MKSNKINNINQFMILYNKESKKRETLNLWISKQTIKIKFQNLNLKKILYNFSQFLNLLIASNYFGI
jgi:hypothetical protein